jgi:hypothetical protein
LAAALVEQLVVVGALDADLNAIAALTGTGWAKRIGVRCLDPEHANRG